VGPEKKKDWMLPEAGNVRKDEDNASKCNTLKRAKGGDSLKKKRQKEGSCFKTKKTKQTTDPKVARWGGKKIKKKRRRGVAKLYKKKRLLKNLGQTRGGEVSYERYR